VDSAVLATIPLFADMPEEDRDRVADVCAALEVGAGETLVTEGDFGYPMCAIADGTEKVVRNETVIRTLGPGEVFGEIAILAGGRRTATVVATTPMRLTVMNRDVWRLERDVPDVGAALRETIARCLESG
jgi:CRP-like cAMP-binding protein